jgi:hypothetical protein
VSRSAQNAGTGTPKEWSTVRLDFTSWAPLTKICFLPNNTFNGSIELIDPSTGEWDSDLSEWYYWEQDAQHILAIPLKQGMVDNLAWHFDLGGV